MHGICEKFRVIFCSKPCRKKPNWETRHRRRDVRMYVRIHVMSFRSLPLCIATI